MWLQIQPARSPSLARPTAEHPLSVIPDDAIIMPAARIYTGSRFGAGLFVGDGASIAEECDFGARCVIGRNVTIGPGVTLGEAVKVMDLSHLTGGMKVGDRTFIGVNVVTMNDPGPQPYLYDVARLRPPVIGSDCTIGSGAILLPGVVIGDRVFVSAGARVSGIIPDGTKVRP
jgi:acetyltransferase-like isoleucine patch superfamily enzyme